MTRTFRVELVLGIALLAVFLLFSGWHAQWGGTLAPEEIDRYMASIERLPLPAEEIAAITGRIRPWAEADDGKPVYMFNMIRYFPEVRRFPGAPAWDGSPAEANKHYEDGITALWLSHAAYPVFNGTGQDRNLINMAPERGWDQATVARYPNRRTFLKLLADPAYAPYEPYKFIALELDLMPVSGDLVVPDLRMIVGGICVFVFMAVGWWRAVRRGAAVRR